MTRTTLLVALLIASIVLMPFAQQRSGAKKSPPAASLIPAKPPKQFFNRGKTKPPGYTHVVTSAPGRMIFISGQGGTGADGTLPPDFTTQTMNTFENIRTCLELAGARFQDIVKINYYLTDLSNTSELRRIRANYINVDSPPASTLIQAGLGSGLLLEVEAIAIIPEQ